MSRFGLCPTIAAPLPDLRRIVSGAEDVQASALRLAPRGDGPADPGQLGARWVPHRWRAMRTEQFRILLMGAGWPTTRGADHTIRAIAGNGAVPGEASMPARRDTKRDRSDTPGQLIVSVGKFASAICFRNTRPRSQRWSGSQALEIPFEACSPAERRGPPSPARRLRQQRMG